MSLEKTQTNSHCEEDGFSININVSCLTMQRATDNIRKSAELLGVIEEHFKSEQCGLSARSMSITLDLR